MKKVVIFGGGTGISWVLSGLKLFPIDVTAVIAVSDDGSSTGVLRQELDIPAVGDLGKVLLAMADVDEDFVKLLRYRFSQDGTLHNHPVRNVLLAALIDLKGSLAEATRYMSRMLNVSGTVLPLSEDRVDLIGHGRDRDYVGQCEVSENIRDIEYISYDRPIQVEPEIVQRVREADLIILSPGSLYTSVIPHLIAPAVREALEATKAPIMYISNLVTQPGETDGYTVADHVRVLDRYMDDRKVDVVIANTGVADLAVTDVYRDKEQKYMVELDAEAVEELGAEIISGDIFQIEDGSIRHDELKTAYLVFSYLMR